MEIKENAPSSNVAIDVKTIDMSGTNALNADNTNESTENVARVPVASKRVKVKLSKPIINNRISYDAGDTLEVKESTADYLEAGDYGKRV